MTSAIFRIFIAGIVILNMSGCAAPLAAVAPVFVAPTALGVNMATKDRTSIIVLKGSGSTVRVFKQAVISNNGTVVQSSAEYAKAEFPSINVKVELQKVESGVYQLVGSGSKGLARSWEFKDNIGETTDRIADHFTQHGFTIAERRRDKGVIGGWETSTVSHTNESPSRTSRKSMVLEVQQMLNSKGYDAGPEDGIVGPQTREALADFQQDRGYPPTGGVTDEAHKQLSSD